MLERITLYNILENHVKLIQESYNKALEADNVHPLLVILQAVKTAFPKIIAETVDVKVALHNVVAQKVYLRAHRRCMAVLDATDYSSATVKVAVNDMYKIIAILNDHATKILLYTTAQLKYHDSLMGMVRKTRQKERLSIIDRAIEVIK